VPVRGNAAGKQSHSDSLSSHHRHIHHPVTVLIHRQARCSVIRISEQREFSTAPRGLCRIQAMIL